MNATIFLQLKQLLTWCIEDATLTTYHIAGGSKNVHVRSMQIYNDFVVVFICNIIMRNTVNVLSSK